MEAGAGFEPATFWLWARRATELLHPAIWAKLLTHNLVKRLNEKIELNDLSSELSTPNKFAMVNQVGLGPNDPMIKSHVLLPTELLVHIVRQFIAMAQGYLGRADYLLLQ